MELSDQKLKSWKDYAQYLVGDVKRKTIEQFLSEFFPDYVFLPKDKNNSFAYVVKKDSNEILVRKMYNTDVLKACIREAERRKQKYEIDKNINNNYTNNKSIIQSCEEKCEEFKLINNEIRNAEEKINNIVSELKRKTNNEFNFFLRKRADGKYEFTWRHNL
ncbi:MAG: hypothetical protein ACOC22_03995 [bacterium]